MNKFFEIPNKLLYVYELLGVVFLGIWVSTFNRYVAIITGMMLISDAIITFIKPELRPRCRYRVPDSKSAEFYNIIQRISSISFIVLSVYIFLNNRIIFVKVLGLVASINSLLFLIFSVFSIINYWKNFNTSIKSFEILSVITFLFVFFAGGYIYFSGAEIDISKYLNLKMGISIVIGTLIGQIILLFGHKKIW